MLSIELDLEALKKFGETLKELELQSSTDSLRGDSYILSPIILLCIF